MHACLNVDEILRPIAHELVASGGRAAAVALACCRKGFEDPVLDVLWETQDRLLPLLKTFPGDVWNEGGCTSFERIPTIIAWARFRKYTRRMRELREPDTLNLSSEVFSVLQLRTINEPLLPNMKTLDFRLIREPLVPFIPLFLSPSTTSISLEFAPAPQIAMVASMFTMLPKLCPNLQMISLRSLPKDPRITAAVSEMLLATNRDTLQEFHTDSPLTGEASEVIYKLSDLCRLSVVIEGETSVPSALLPNLTSLEIICDDESGWPRLFHGATFGELEFVMFFPRSEEIDNFLGAFKTAALSSSVQNTLSEFYVYASCPWNPNYSSLLPFTQLVGLAIGFACDYGCSSRVDDDVVISLSQAMPKLQDLELGYKPCGEPTAGVTATGLVALALHCPDLEHLRIHFQVASLSAPPASPGIGRNAESSGSRAGCALTTLDVGKIDVKEESALTVALTLLRIFPRIEKIDFLDEGWKQVADAIQVSKQIVDCSRTTP